MNFLQVKNIDIPEGEVVKIYDEKGQIWGTSKFVYVSLGDSIAAGHNINSAWEKEYGLRSQYGEGGRTSTKIVKNSYTDLIREQIITIHGEKASETISFAHSGDQVHNLVNRLDDKIISTKLKAADLVTVCIGANNILVPAMEKHFSEYVKTGDLTGLQNTINQQLSILGAVRNSETGEYPYSSYGSLFDKLHSINKRTQYVFTTIYNPYKYLWLDKGIDGFFAPLLNTIPDFNVGIPNTNLQFSLGNFIKTGILNTYYIQLLFNRTNGLGQWLEPYINALNDVLRSKVSEYNSYRNSSNFKVAETKALFDTIPDRPVPNDVHYNDLVNVEFTRGYDTAQMNWNALFGNKTAMSFWVSLATKHLNFKNAFPSTNPADWVNFDMLGFAAELVTLIIERVIVPDVDPHPKPYGHIVLKSAFNQVMQLQ